MTGSEFGRIHGSTTSGTNRSSWMKPSGNSRSANASDEPSIEYALRVLIARAVSPPAVATALIWNAGWLTRSTALVGMFDETLMLSGCLSTIGYLQVYSSVTSGTEGTAAWAPVAPPTPAMTRAAVLAFANPRAPWDMRDTSNSSVGKPSKLSFVERRTVADARRDSPTACARRHGVHPCKPGHAWARPTPVAHERRGPGSCDCTTRAPTRSETACLSLAPRPSGSG